MRKQEIIKLYEVAEEAVFPDSERLLLICISRTIEIEDEAYSLYDKVRYSWKVSPTRAEQADYVLAVAHGLIVGVFENGTWMDATQSNFGGEIPGRYGNWENQNGRSGFRGREASDGVKKRYLHKRVPDELRGHGSPIRYLGL